jgi:hypothetical protein
MSSWVVTVILRCVAPVVALFVASRPAAQVQGGAPPIAQAARSGLRLSVRLPDGKLVGPAPVVAISGVSQFDGLKASAARDRKDASYVDVTLGANSAIARRLMDLHLSEAELPAPTLALFLVTVDTTARTREVDFDGCRINGAETRSGVAPELVIRFSMKCGRMVTR